jgi:hypothetical protein
VLPEALRGQALRLFHNGLAHPGRRRTWETLKEHYFWEGAGEDIKDHVQKCLYCLKRKDHKLTTKVPLQRYDIPPYPFYRAHIDVTGPFPTSESGNKYIVVFKDALTKWIELLAIPDTTAVTIAEFLFDEVVCRYGPLKELVSDRGHEFMNETMKELCQLMKIKKLVTAPYNPRANGMVENFMKTLKDQLQAFVSKAHNNWDIYLSSVAYAYRTTVSSATGYTPHYALFGREAPTTSEEWLWQFARRKGLTEHIRGVAEALKKTWTGMGTRLEKNQENQERTVREPRQFKPYSVGQEVALRSIPKLKYKQYLDKEEFELSKKLQYRYDGPFTIKEIISPITYRILKEDGKLHTVAFRNMKPYRTDSTKPARTGRTHTQE